MTDTTLTRGALVVPGSQGGPYTPLLMYAADAAEMRGAHVDHLWWTRTDPARGVPVEPVDFGAWTAVDLKPAFDRHGPTRPLVIAKSLGTTAAPYAADWDVPAIWLTPLLHNKWVVEGLRRATAPFLIVGGTEDRRWWNGDLARELTPYVHEVEGANHGMYVPGTLADSMRVLAGVVEAVEAFMDDVVWPAKERAVWPEG